METNKIKLFSAFAGYGTDNFALKQLGVPFELVGFSEIDKYAIQCFQKNHNLGNKLLSFGDIRNINPNELPDFDLFTGGFPCQPFSVAGKRLGELDIRGTLFYEIIRICEIKKPKYILLENVKGLTNRTFKETFNKILGELDRIGYNVYWKILNTKDFGIPQSRARVWFVCFRKDIDVSMKFQFPKPFPLTIFIKDILEEQVDEKYYLSEKLQERFKKYIEERNNKLGNEPAIPDLYNRKVKNDGTRITLPDPCHNNLMLIEEVHVHSLYPRTGNPDDGGVGHLSKDDGTSYAIDTGNCQAVVYDRKGFDSRTKGFRENDLSPTLSQKMGTGGNNVPMIANYLKIGGRATKPFHYYEKKHDNFVGNIGRLRRLTPKECFRLQGFLNDEVNLNGLSDTQCYKLAGNGQSVNVVKLILKEMLKC